MDKLEGWGRVLDEVEPTSGCDFVRGMVTGRASADSRR